MSAIPKSNWIAIYKQLQREATKFPQTNYRSFFHRRIRDHFAKNSSVTDPQQQAELYKEAERNLQVLRRQAVVYSLYPHQKTVVEVNSDLKTRECRKCKSNEYTNKSLVMLVNECGHPLCRTCVDNLFARNAAPCEICGKMLKRNNFWEQVFEDPMVEKENFIRRRFKKVFNMKEEDFPTLRDFNDYLEHVEVLVMNLLYEENIEETEREVREYQKDQNEKLNVKDTKEIMKELRESNVAAEMILDRERKRQIEQDLEQKEEMERKKKLKKERKRNDGLTFAAHRIAGRPYFHRPMVIDTNGPPMLTINEIESGGYLRFIREPSAHRRAGGYTTSIACFKALLEVRLDLFAVKTMTPITASE
ncbi:unnamed protein product, partial [Mesorhabditis spiculigera]